MGRNRIVGKTRAGKERKKTRVAIVGSRKRLDRQTVEAYVSTLNSSEDVVVSDGRWGVDSWAEAAALARGLTVEVFLPDKAKMKGGNRGDVVEAYYARNRLIVEASDRLVAFQAPRDRYGGTGYTIRYAESQGVPVELR